MPKRKVISTAKTPDQLQKAYLDAVSALRHAGITMPIKKYDEHKVPGWMAGNKKAEFCFSTDDRHATFTVEVGSQHDPLAQYDIATKNKEDEVRLIAALQHMGLMDAKSAEERLTELGLRKVERRSEDQPPDWNMGVVKDKPVIGGHRAPKQPVIGTQRRK